MSSAPAGAISGKEACLTKGVKSMHLEGRYVFYVPPWIPGSPQYFQFILSKLYGESFGVVTGTYPAFVYGQFMRLPFASWNQRNTKYSGSVIIVWLGTVG